MTQQSSPLAQPASNTISDGFGSTWSNRCPRCGENSMSVVRPGKVQCDSEKCYQMDMMEEEQFKKDVEYIMAVPDEGKRERIRKGLYELLIGIVDSEKDRQFVLSYLDGVLDSLLPEKVDHQAISEEEIEKLIATIKSRKIDCRIYPADGNAVFCKTEELDNDIDTLILAIRSLQSSLSQKEEECRRYREALEQPCPACSNIANKYPGSFIYTEACSKCQACSKALSPYKP